MPVDNLIVVNAKCLSKDGVVAVNFACAKNFDQEGIKTKACIFVPTIGAVTTAMLQRNCVRLYKYSVKSLNSRTVTATKAVNGIC